MVKKKPFREPMSLLHEAIAAGTALECLAGMAVAGIAGWRPSLLPRFFRGWPLPWPERTPSAALPLFGQALGWMLLTCFSSVLLIPLLPVYTTFRWLDAFQRAAYAIGFREADQETVGRNERGPDPTLW